jgi:hypothetical protein
VTENHAFRAQEVQLAAPGRCAGGAKKAAWCEVRGNHTVAGNLRGKGVGAQGLTDGARGAATDTATEGGVGDDAPWRNLAEGGVNFGREAGDPAGGLKV